MKPYKCASGSLYESSRNEFINPSAEHADRIHGKYPNKADHHRWKCDWTCCFFAEMDRLCVESGLIKSSRL